MGENGLAVEAGRASIVQIDRQSGATQPFATGLRNPNGMAWEPTGGKLWTVVNERDELGDDLVPDYLTAVTPAGFYGWLYSDFGQHVGSPVCKPSNPRRWPEPSGPMTHWAPMWPRWAWPLRRAAHCLRHVWPAAPSSVSTGSWNRTPRSGYKVVYLPFANGRPVGVVVANSGALLVADDVGNTIWRVRVAAR